MKSNAARQSSAIIIFERLITYESIQSGHRWRFSTVGGIKRVNIEKGSDLRHLGELDQKLWTVLSCPVNGLEMDTRTLQLIDLDGAGKIGVPEAAAAPAVPFDIGKFVGVFAAISLALGAIGTALAAGIGGFLGLEWWKMPLAIAGLI